MPPEPRAQTPTLEDTVAEIGLTLATLDPGALASLRRMSLEDGDHGAPYFWRLASRHDFGSGARLATWARIVQIMAILTDKGAANDKRSPHAGRHGLGRALCDGADPAWGQGSSDPRPMLSELRFARLLAAKGPVRAELMERAARTLAVKKPADTGVNCTDLAWLLLLPDQPAPARKLARDYYARLDRATSRAGAEADDLNTDASGDAA